MQWSYEESFIYTVTLIMKGTELELEKVWPEFGSIDFSYFTSSSQLVPQCPHRKHPSVIWQLEQARIT